jgi:hypothetical protein
MSKKEFSQRSFSGGKKWKRPMLLIYTRQEKLLDVLSTCKSYDGLAPGGANAVQWQWCVEDMDPPYGPTCYQPCNENSLS